LRGGDSAGAAGVCTFRRRPKSENRTARARKHSGLGKHRRFQGACHGSENAIFCSGVVREQAETPVLPCRQTSRILTNGSFKRLPAHALSVQLARSEGAGHIRVASDTLAGQPRQRSFGSALFCIAFGGGAVQNPRFVSVTKSRHYILNLQSPRRAQTFSSLWAERPGIRRLRRDTPKRT